MFYNKSVVSDCMLHIGAYVTLDSPLDCAIKKMQKFNIKQITITDEDFNLISILSKNSIERGLNTGNFKKETCVSDAITKDQTYVVGYPQSDLDEIFEIMNTRKIDCLPIVKSPWDKKLLGFVTCDKTNSAI